MGRKGGSFMIFFYGQPGKILFEVGEVGDEGRIENKKERGINEMRRIDKQRLKKSVYLN